MPVTGPSGLVTGTNNDGDITGKNVWSGPDNRLILGGYGFAMGKLFPLLSLTESKVFSISFKWTSLLSFKQKKKYRETGTYCFSPWHIDMFDQHVAIWHVAYCMAFHDIQQDVVITLSHCTAKGWPEQLASGLYRDHEIGKKPIRGTLDHPVVSLSTGFQLNTGPLHWHLLFEYLHDSSTVAFLWLYVAHATYGQSIGAFCQWLWCVST